jgi:chemotaxis protein methyltransferase CheR
VTIAKPRASDRVADVLVDGEFVLRPEDFRRIAAMLYMDAGIVLPDSKATMLYSRLAKRLRALGLDSFRQYCALIADESGLDERQQMLAAMTTNVTRFFREPHHFDHLRAEILPRLLAQAENGGRVRIWSAGCSRGHEPYSLAMTILALCPKAASWDVKILASDIDVAILEEGRAGEFSDEVLADVPVAARKRFLTPVARGEQTVWRVSDEMRRLVAFRELNLIGPWPMSGTFQVIMCRNVVIYFDEATQDRTFSRFARQLAPGGLLYVGHSERLVGGSAGYYDSVGVTTYRVRSGVPG